MKFFKSQFSCAHWYGGAVIDLQLLNKIDLCDGPVSIHYQNIRLPAIEMFKTLKGVSDYKQIALQINREV